MKKQIKLTSLLLSILFLLQLIIPIVTNATITANWQINTSNLQVNLNGGSWEDSTEVTNITQNYNTTRNIPIPIRT